MVIIENMYQLTPVSIKAKIDNSFLLKINFLNEKLFFFNSSFIRKEEQINRNGRKNNNTKLKSPNSEDISAAGKTRNNALIKMFFNVVPFRKI